MRRPGRAGPITRQQRVGVATSNASRAAPNQSIRLQYGHDCGHRRRRVRTVGVRELRDGATELLRRVRDDGETIEVTYHGRVVARLVPVRDPDEPAASASAWRAQADALAVRIGRAWPADVSAVEAVREQRRDL
jgi:prevent-host-death family protein